MIVGIVLAGGVGTRLWPLSREDYPKQFNKLIGEKSLFHQSLERAYSSCDKVVIVANYNYRFVVESAIHQLGYGDVIILYEKFGHNTAPAILATGQWLLQNKIATQESLLLVIPSDHYINQLDNFCRDVERAALLARKNKLVCFGIQPDSPNVGYGYVNVSSEKEISFVEKPSLEKAKEYIQNGNYLWNSGIFCFNISSLEREANKYCPTLFKKVSNLIASDSTNIVFDYKKNTIENISIDYALFEKSKDVACVSASFNWSDVGSWSALYDAMEKNSNGNVVVNDNTLIDSQSKNNLVYGHGRLISLIGVENLLIVDIADTLLICNKNSSQDVKLLVERLKKVNNKITKENYFSYRPWGSFRVLSEGDNYKIKEIVVNSNQALSLQSHKRRSEHWVVIDGIAQVTKGEKKFQLNKNQSVFIPEHCLHRLENNEAKPLIVVEVQTGSYLEEDDIVRYDDQYNRVV